MNIDWLVIDVIRKGTRPNTEPCGTILHTRSNVDSMY